MKKLIAILGLIGVSMINVKAQQQEFVFDGRDYLDCVIAAKPVYHDKDSIPDAYMIAYDLNKNGKIDHYAQYEQYLDSLGKINYYHNPSIFYHDDDEDGIPESAHIDKDMDGILETFKLNPNLKKSTPEKKKKPRDTNIRRT